MTAEELAEAAAAAMWADDKASRDLGMVLESIGPGHATLTMTVTPEMTNGHGTCHGGFLFTLADSAFAFACNSYNQKAVAQHCSVTYLVPVPEGAILRAEAREVSRQGRSGIYDVTLYVDGTTVALFRGHSRTVPGEHVPGLG